MSPNYPPEWLEHKPHLPSFVLYGFGALEVGVKVFLGGGHSSAREAPRMLVISYFLI